MLRRNTRNYHRRLSHTALTRRAEPPLANKTISLCYWPDYAQPRNVQKLPQSISPLLLARSRTERGMCNTTDNRGVSEMPLLPASLGVVARSLLAAGVSSAVVFAVRSFPTCGCRVKWCTTSAQSVLAVWSYTRRRIYITGR